MNLQDAKEPTRCRYCSARTC
ncbi:MAG: hypothetical protein KKD30_15995 [Gammaproteobacteria bacterium]|nr:hypothetical protein [Gammaproteobacteria bacterium]MBU0884610.1 hypothetical protein [Gammaproteobacteria bacterium]MBU0901500.1 hypothetical protein [Gammaproteobacteria bacterium]MBU1861444.1 hypothetical protein [Gammaproteobacteria bacterium]